MPLLVSWLRKRLQTIANCFYMKRSFQKHVCFVGVFFQLLTWYTSFAGYPVSAWLGIDQGLSNNFVRCIYQDKNGFMWFGTYDGLNRYDGYEFKTFRNNFKNNRSLINNWINAIGEDAIVVSESVTNFHVVSQHLRRTRPGTLFSSGGGSLGYNGGAAVGVKLARPDALVVAICGDGSYLFSQPSTVHWMARAYQAPFLHVVLNNGGWRAPRQAVLSVHPEGIAARAPKIDIDFPQPPDYAGIAAAAGGAHAERVKTVAEVKPALERALRAIREERRAAVIDAHIA